MPATYVPGPNGPIVLAAGFDINGFFGGAAGAWYDPSVLASVWQDSARTTPGAVNSPVGAIDAQNSGGPSALQATAGKRPILRQSGALFYLEFDGVDDCLQIVSITLNTSVYVGMGVNQTSGKPLLIEHSASENANQGFYIYGSNNKTWALRRSGENSGFGAANWADGQHIIELAYAAAVGGEYYKDAVLQATSISGSAQSASDITDNLNIMSRDQASIFGGCNLFHLIVRSGAPPNGTVRAQLETIMAAKSGVTL